MDLQTSVKDSVRYWEKRRIIYNLVLFSLVAIFWGPDIIQDPPFVVFVGCVAILLPLAIASNILYCAAYPADLLGQYVFESANLKHFANPFRLSLFLCGLTLSTAITLYFLTGPDPGH